MEGVKLYIIGGGPSGFATACLAANKGALVTVYEGKQNIWAPQSHLLGLNKRGQNTFNKIRPGFVDVLEGETVEAFAIIKNNTKMLGRNVSGNTIGTTRDDVNGQLYEEAKKNPNVTIKLGHKLMSVDMESKTLIFMQISPDGKETEISVKASDGYVIACDGVWSRTRRSVVEQRPEIEPKMEDWGFSVRVLYTNPDIKPDIDAIEGVTEGDHIIFGDARMYAAKVKTRWLLGFTLSPETETAKFIGAKEATDEAMAAMKNHIATTCSPFSNCIGDEELKTFFSSRAFGGAIVWPKTLQCDEWVAFLGDSAHSVLPLAGEGVNSALEDATKFVESMENSLAAKSETPLGDYNEARLPDVEALSEYAKYLRDSGASTDPCYRATVTATSILLSRAKKWGFIKHTLSDYSSGSMAPTLTPYRDVIAMWRGQKDAVFDSLYWCLSWFVPKIEKKVEEETKPEDAAAEVK